MTINIAVFPGSFDPFTLGHFSVIKRALPIFDQIIISIGINNEKKTFFPLDQRIKWIEKIFSDEKKIVVDSFKSLTVDYCSEIGAKYLLRGLRTATDFEYERQIGQINRTLNQEIETVYFLTLPEHTHISSTIVREIIKYKRDVSEFVPKEIAQDILKTY
ncbi:MAG: pantetheine-phosphate adenylyltransferase [Bacteroidota bacterium]|nr:pantetheine-phosphate adenylyltransferase [Bacteroidota bacterium]